MIILNSNKNKSIFEIFEKYNNLINIPYIECPVCNSTKLIKWGSYKRNIYYIHCGNIIHNILTVKRVLCKECGHTHALLPSFIIPYKVNLLDIILNALKNDDITLNYSFDTIIKWNKEFKSFLPFLKTLLGNIDIIYIIDKILNDIFSFYYQFYKLFKRILMLKKKCYIYMAHF